MSYDLNELAKRVATTLKRQPLTSLAALSRDLRLDRHTVTRALRAHLGKSFREVQDEVLVDFVRTEIARCPTMSIKEIASSVGYNHSRSMARRIRRLTGHSPTEHRKAES